MIGHDLRPRSDPGSNHQHFLRVRMKTSKRERRSQEVEVGSILEIGACPGFQRTISIDETTRCYRDDATLRLNHPIKAVTRRLRTPAFLEAQLFIQVAE